MKPFNQTVMALIIILTMFGGFAGVYYAEYSFEQTHDTEMIFQTDANTEFSSYPSTPYNITTATSYVNANFTWVQIPKTPVYLGNNTWGVSQSTTPTPPVTATGTRHEIVIDIPITESWYIDYINVSLYNPTLPSGSTLYMIIYNVVEIITPVNGWYNYSMDLTTYETLTIMNYVQSTYPDSGIYFLIFIEAPTGTTLPNHAYIFDAQIYGYLLTTWTLQDSINTVIGISIMANIFIGIMMLDNVDLGGKIKHLTRQKTNKKGKRKR